MSAYDHDLRAVPVKYAVHHDGGWAVVELRGGFGGRWWVSRSNADDVDFATSDEAIRSLIGDPQ